MTYRTGYCHDCGAERDILLTVPWQENTCRRCGGTAVEVRDEE